MYLIKWFVDNGDTTLRLNYPLTEDSIVFDLGGYKGDFAHAINSKYGCYVYIFEPVNAYYLQCVDRFKDNKKILCFNYGLLDKDCKLAISNENDGSSILKNNTTDNCEQVSIKCFAETYNTLLGTSCIDLLKVNIEGSEFPLLAHIITSNTIQKIKHLQVQFHNFYPNSVFLREEIRSKLSETHIEAWNYPFVWESWTKKV